MTSPPRFLINRRNFLYHCVLSAAQHHPRFAARDARRIGRSLRFHPSCHALTSLFLGCVVIIRRRAIHIYVITRVSCNIQFYEKQYCFAASFSLAPMRLVENFNARYARITFESTVEICSYVNESSRLISINSIILRVVDERSPIHREIISSDFCRHYPVSNANARTRAIIIYATL